LKEIKSILPNINWIDGKLNIINKKSKIYADWEYIKKYHLYLFFTLPPLVLLIIFKYIPMGGVLIAFEDYSAISGAFHSQWVRLKHFERFLDSPDFMNLLMNTLKISLNGLL